MVGSKSNKALDAVGAGGGVSEVYNIQRARDEVGLFFVDVSGSSIDLSVRIQGRPDATAAWFNIQSIVEGDLSATTNGGTVAVVVALFPQMRVNCNKLTGTTPVLSAWLVE